MCNRIKALFPTIYYLKHFFAGIVLHQIHIEFALTHFLNFCLKHLLHKNLNGKVILRIFNGIKMRYTDKLIAEQVLLGGYEKLAYYRPKKADVVIDVGAFIGLYSLKAAKAVKPEGSVVAVEPNPIAFA
jgi:hypothetical protein